MQIDRKMNLGHLIIIASIAAQFFGTWSLIDYRLENIDKSISEFQPVARMVERHEIRLNYIERVR